MAIAVGFSSQAAAQPAVTYYVAPGGDDDNPGTQGEPFASLERARDAVRALTLGPGLPAGGVTVYLRGGTYQRLAPLQLDTRDSGDVDLLVRWAAYPGEEVSISGGAVLEAEWFESLAADDPVRSRFVVPEVDDEVLVVDLPAHGVSDYGTLVRRGYSASGAPSALELFVDAAPMELARWPNRGHTDPIDPSAPAEVSGDLFGGGTSFTFLGAVGSGNADDGYPSYHAEVGGADYYLYHCTWEWGGGIHRYWFISTHDPVADPSCWPDSSTSWLGAGTDAIPPLEPMGGSASELVLARNRPVDFADHGFVRIPAVVDDQCFALPGTRFQQWTQAEEPWFQGLFGNYWADDTLAGTVGAGGQVCLAQSPSYGISVNQPFFALNLLEEIDTPGEYYLDRTSGRLYLMPPADLTGLRIEVSLTQTPLLELSDVQHLRFEGLTFELARGALVVADGVADVVFSDCRLRNCGAGAIELTGTDSGLERCEINNPGEHGVRLEGGSRPLLSDADDFVRNCEIHHFGRWGRTYRPAVRLAGCGHIVEHNLFHDAPHSAILFTGNRHRIEYNDIERVVLEANDAGAIYSGRDWGYRGTLIRYNFIHAVDSAFGGAHGVYLDDALSGMTVFGNVLYGINGRATVNGGGRDNVFANNVIVDCFSGGHSADRRARSAANYLFSGARPNTWNLLGRVNVVYESYQYLTPIAYQSNPWASVYPTLAAMPNDWTQVEGSHWLEPEGCVFARNISWHAEPLMTEGTWGGAGAFDWYAEISPNLEEVDPLFVDEAGGDLTLQPGSPAFTMAGFLPIPFAQIGIQPSAEVLFADGFESGDLSLWSAQQ